MTEQEAYAIGFRAAHAMYHDPRQDGDYHCPWGMARADLRLAWRNGFHDAAVIELRRMREEEENN